MAQRAAQHVAHVQFARPHVVVIQLTVLFGDRPQHLPPGLLGAAQLLRDAGVSRLLQIRIVQQHAVGAEDRRLRLADQRAGTLRQPVQIAQRVL